ncbi:hypothetical protein K450DRAFT_232751 [Umbelopsis ramanniana AG]|uniref:Uncharacterized protein n=1 Tax=Umbelopsis ramanniana AG TaxID=1314678 RepID=A0AAD5EDV3_UMBRA|nr:uncharacterized protein K450DRAFT_232751 [Umbelopsis ramanniana AG]KAI8581374.1 hypothetical protein K450DRAFT_232751 [Umbelopsis ramanniana AG]
MKQKNPTNFSLDKSSSNPVKFDSGDNTIQVHVVSDCVIRVQHHFSHEGCLKEAVSSSFKDFEVADDTQSSLSIKTSKITVKVNYSPDFYLTWYYNDDLETPFAEDLACRAYPYDPKTGAIWHYTRRNVKDHYYGLGERSGDLDLHGRRFRLERLDCMGYDAENMDPLYKFCPFYITLSGTSKKAHGIYYNNFTRSSFDLGDENDAMWGPYKYYNADCGPLDYYVFWGPEIKDVVQEFSDLMGRPKELPPRYSLGYLASSMAYAEVDNAQEALEEFAQNCHKHDIPCDGMHLSSGYTVNEEGERCVFTWNLNRFPDPKAFTDNLRKAGIHLFANIKPWLLESHPDYDLMKEQGGYVLDDEGKPGRVMQWKGGRGTMGASAYIDFTTPAGFDYWKSKVKEQLLEYGIEGCWNDNNEFTMTDDDFSIACEKHPWVDVLHKLPTERTAIGYVGTPLLTMLMAQSSYEAIREFWPEKRPFVITRSATPFIHQIVPQTWSGDNYTAWKTIKYNVPMGSSAALSIFPAGYGHDVGGFAGPKPDPDLFVRWVQQAIYMPRFSIHSWNIDDSVTEPWTYPEVLPVIRSSIHYRYRLIPFLYNLLVNFHRTGQPVLRPIVYHCQDDPETHQQSFEFMVGESLMVAPVYEPNVTKRTVYLPKTYNWYHLQTGKYYTGGQKIDVDAPLDAEAAPAFFRESSLIPLGKTMQHVGFSADDERVIEVWPSHSSSGEVEHKQLLVEDDGISTKHTDAKEYTELEISMRSTAKTITLDISVVHQNFKPAYNTLSFVLKSADDDREIVFAQKEGSQFKVHQKSKGAFSIDMPWK